MLFSLPLKSWVQPRAWRPSAIILWKDCVYTAPKSPGCWCNSIKQLKLLFYLISLKENRNYFIFYGQTILFCIHTYTNISHFSEFSLFNSLWLLSGWTVSETHTILDVRQPLVSCLFSHISFKYREVHTLQKHENDICVMLKWSL